jgi:hypothetical protein
MDIRNGNCENKCKVRQLLLVYVSLSLKLSLQLEKHHAINIAISENDYSLSHESIWGSEDGPHI